MSCPDVETRRRIDAFVASVRHDRVRSNELFHYVWTMICVRRGLLRVVQEMDAEGGAEFVLEETATGRRRRVTRPRDLDSEMEDLAVHALASILGEMRVGT